MTYHEKEERTLVGNAEVKLYFSLLTQFRGVCVGLGGIFYTLLPLRQFRACVYIVERLKSVFRASLELVLCAPAVLCLVSHG